MTGLYKPDRNSYLVYTLLDIVKQVLIHSV